MTDLIQTFLIHFTYVALILILFAAGMGVPIPEDIPLIISGWLCHPDFSPVLADSALGVVQAAPKVPHLWIMIGAGLFGVLGGDSLIWYVGRRGIDADNFIARHIRKVMTPGRREKVESHFRKHGSLTVFIGRFMPGLRSVVFAMAGLSGMSYLRFILINGIAAMISVPTFVCLGYFFAGRIHQVLAAIEHAKGILTPLAILLVVIIAIVLFLRRRSRVANQTDA